MRNILKVLIIALISINIASCSKKAEKKEFSSEMDNLPAWIANPEIEGTIAAVGLAPKSRGGLQFQIPQAEADARANIAAQIETEVSRLTKDALRKMQLDEEEEVENLFTQATKNLVKQVPIMGAKRVKMYKDPDDGSLFIQMAIDSEMVTTYFKKNKSVLKAKISTLAIPQDKKDKAQKAANQLFKDLDDEIKK